MGGHPGKDSSKPDDSEKADAKKGYNHRSEGVAQSAHDAHDDFHNATEEVGEANPEEAGLASFDD